MTHRSKKAKLKHRSFTSRYWMWGLALIVLVAVAAIFWPKPLTQSVKAMDKLPASISVQQAQTLRNEGAFILDVRSLAEWQAVHIPGSILIPLDQLESRLAEIPKDVKIVVVCRSGNRSAQGRSALLNAGFPLVTSMKGGMVSWQANGYDTISGN